MPPPDDNFNAAVEKLAGYVSGPPLSNGDLCDWSRGPLLSIIDWPRIALHFAPLIAGIGLIVWIIRRKRKRDTN
jgi:hypothetical protein